MFGKLLSVVTKIVTLPIDVANIGMDVLCGGDGSKESRMDSDSPFSMLENVRDKITDTIENIDK